MCVDARKCQRMLNALELEIYAVMRPSVWCEEHTLRYTEKLSSARSANAISPYTTLF